MDLKSKLQEIPGLSLKKRVDRRLIYTLGIFGLLLIALVIGLLYSDMRGKAAVAESQAETQEILDQLAQPVQSLRRTLTDDRVQALASRALDNPDTLLDLAAYLSGRIPQISEVRVIPADVLAVDPAALGPNGFAMLDMAISALGKNTALLQFHGSAQPPRLADAQAVNANGELRGVVVVLVDPDYLLDGFSPEFSALGYVRLAQFNGLQPPNLLAEFGDPLQLGDLPDRIAIPGTMLRLEYPLRLHVALLQGSTLILLLVAGALCIVGAATLQRSNRIWAAQAPAAERDGPELVLPRESQPPRVPAASSPTVAAPSTVADENEPEGEVERLPEPPPMQLHYDLSARRKVRESDHEPVELSAAIFRAYDIRGVIDKTLDSGIAKQVGQVVGTLALEKDAGPVVVARDGRLSGPYLQDGMVEGILSTGCDVLDIGAVPTGVLYYAAHEKAAGSGVMITGSHNPPDYNGFKIMIGGDTLHGKAIKDIHRRIEAGEVRTGEGELEQRDVVADYIQRIADDIQVERPLRVVIDCGNGIGGICAADTLRAIGVEVLPLFDEVDGTFPNHHPDPSEPENLKDLIESVRLMDADLGLALDGDADRLGVVTLAGNIIYPDRVMMLLAMDVLDRNPGATIIYDVKCTGHLPKVIEEAGGKPVMYKTGHSLIKAYMKELGAPFAGEMSGHFFFAERWYGVDDGIYAAARLLEILGSTETPPEAILNALPTSYSTPELKVQMQEGENHAFIEDFKAAAHFEAAKISTIDGLRADFADGWGLVRASNTTPILVLRFDAETEEALSRIKESFRAVMLQVKQDLDLPF
ncbi:MAG: phosphomannomutase/phosphoglucomutase [Xanthomonadales bacterium]|nr:phosphomannomutase/phosphoglucomutase [Xanthomonadales bacterium]